MTIYFRNFSTWTGRLGIYLEDLYVRPEARGRGVGRALMGALADEAHAHGYARIDWSVLDWNESAIGFYESIGAVPMDGWTGYRLSGEALTELGLPGRPDLHGRGMETRPSGVTELDYVVMVKFTSVSSAPPGKDAPAYAPTSR